MVQPGWKSGQGDGQAGNAYRQRGCASHMAGHVQPLLAEVLAGSFNICPLGDRIIRILDRCQDCLRNSRGLVDGSLDLKNPKESLEPGTALCVYGMVTLFGTRLVQQSTLYEYVPSAKLGLTAPFAVELAGIHMGDAWTKGQVVLGSWLMQQGTLRLFCHTNESAL